MRAGYRSPMIAVTVREIEKRPMAAGVSKSALMERTG